MAYYPDLSKINLKQYAEVIKNKKMIPSRESLKTNIDKIMLDFIILGYKDIGELLKLLKNKKTFDDLMSKDLFNKDDLNNLKREIAAMHPKANKFSDFIFIDKGLIQKIEEAGIKNTKQLFDQIKTKKDREDLSNKTGIILQDINMLTSLCDISRIQWVNHTFAYVLYRAGYNNLDKVKNANADELYNNIKSVNREEQLYKGHIGLNDMKILIEASQIVPSDIIF